MKDDKKLHVDVREAELEDLAPIYALGERLFTADKWTSLHRTWDEYEVLNLYMTDGETCLVAEYDGKVVGFVLGATIDKRHSSWKYGYLLWLGVSPEAKGLGVGKKLVKRITDLFIQDGARMMIVDTDAENEDAIGFFKKTGFSNEQQHVYMSMNLTKHPSYDRLRPTKPDKKDSKTTGDGAKKHE